MEVTQAGPTKATIELRQAKYVGSIVHLRGYEAQVLVRSDRTFVRAKIFGPLARSLAHEWNEYPNTDFEIGELIPMQQKWPLLFT
jgi:hypothetical protein